MIPRSLFNEQQKPGFWRALPELLGHVIGGAVLFMSIAAVAWLIGFGVGRLNAIQPFSPAVLSVLHGFELGLLYLDIIISGIVVVVGGYRFLKEIV